MQELKKILFATDFSDTSQHAQETAAYLSRSLGGSLEVAHVFDPSAFEMPGPYYFMPGVEHWLDKHFTVLRERGHKALEELSKKLGGCPTHFIEGRPGPSLVEFAEKNGFDMIVLGTHGHRGLNRLFLGSVADYVLHHSTCTVMVVKTSTELEEKAG